MGMKRSERALAIIAACMISAGDAAAFDEPLSRRYFNRAIALAREGNHRAAIAEFERAYEANPRPSIVYNLAHEHRILGEGGRVDDLRLAVSLYGRYLVLQPNATDRARVERLIVDLKERIASAEFVDRMTRPETPVPDPPRQSQVDLAPTPASAPATDRASSTSTGPRAPRARALWWVLGASMAVVAGVSIGLAVGLTRNPGEPETTLGLIGAMY